MTKYDSKVPNDLILVPTAHAMVFIATNGFFRRAPKSRECQLQQNLPEIACNVVHAYATLPHHTHLNADSLLR